MFRKIQKLVVVSFVISTISVSLIATSPVFAVDVLNPPGSTTGACDNPNARGRPAICDENSGTNPLFGPDGIITTAVRILSIIAGVGAVVVIIFQALRMISSAGDSQSVTIARNGIMYALIGLAIAVSAQVLVAFVLNKVR